MRHQRSIEECDKGDCSYSDHCPRSLTPALPLEVKRENHAGPSGNKDVKLEVAEQPFQSSSDSYNSD